MRNLKIIGIVGSPRKGNTEIMVRAALEEAKEVGAETEIILLRDLKLEMCDGCLECDKTGKCHFDDGMNEINERIAEANGFIIGTPTRWSLLSGNLKVFLDRTNPLAVPGRLKGKVAGIIGVGQSPEDEEEQSIKKAADSVKNYCSNAGIDVIGMVLGFNAINEGDMGKNIKTLEDCKKIGKKLVEHLKGKTCGG
jgi:multimeric flavodoxin WrbA